MLEEAQEVVRRAAEDTEPASMVQKVCYYQSEIIALQPEVTMLTTQVYPPLECDYTETDIRMQTRIHGWEEVRRKLMATATDEKLWEELAGMTWDAQQHGEEV